MNDRDDHLLALLDIIVPAVADNGDWDAVTTQASQSRIRRRLWRHLAPVLATGAVVAVFVILLIYTGAARESTPASTGAPPTETRGGPGHPSDVINDFSDNGIIDMCHSKADYDSARKELVNSPYGDYQGALDTALANPALVGTATTPCPPPSKLP